MSGVQRKALRDVLSQGGDVRESAAHHDGVRLQGDVDGRERVCGSVIACLRGVVNQKS